MTDGLLLDTSALIAADGLHSVDAGAISVLTLGELHAGVVLARDPATQHGRARRLDWARAAFVAIAVDAAVADAYGRLVAFARARRRAAPPADLLIVATAQVTGRALVTLDEAQARLAAEAGVAVAP